MQLTNRIKQGGAATLLAATMFLMNSHGLAGDRNVTGPAVNRHGGDDPAGHDAGDDHGRRHGRGGNPAPMPAGTPDDHGHHHGGGGHH